MRLLSRPPVVWTTIVVLSLAITITAPPHAALAALTLEQQQPTIDTTVGGLAIGHNSQQILGQTVTAGATGDLVRVDLPVACDGTGDLIIEIRDVAPGGAPGATILSTTTIPGTTLPSFPLGGVTFRALALATPLSVVPGAKYAIVLRSNGTTVNDGCGIFRGPVGDSYIGGDLYFGASPNLPGWIRNCGEFPGERCDLPFKTWVGSIADLSIKKTLVNPNNLNVFAGTDQFYQFTVTNAGPSMATGVTITDTLPNGVTYISGGPCINNNGTLTCSLGPQNSNLAAGASFTTFIQVRFANAGSYTNTASVTANETDLNTTNNSSSQTQQVLPTADLFIPSSLIDPTVAAPGGTVTYDVTLRNLGPDPTNDVVLMQTIPAGSTFVSIASPSTPMAICASGTNPGEYGCRFSTIPVNATRTMTVTVTAPSTPQALNTSWVATHVVPPFILDPPQGAPSSMTARSWVVFETVSGANVTTLTTGAVATPDDPIETTVESPTSGAITITEQKQGASPAPTSWRSLGSEVVISAPAGSASAPLRLTFRFDSSYVAQFTAATLEIFRNNSNTPVPDCTQPVSPTLPSMGTPISPDPCVWRRSTLSDNDIEIVVFTSQASVWTFAVHTPFAFGGFQPPLHEGTTVANAGRAVPVKFSLDGFQGMVILDRAPVSRAVTCASGGAAGPLTPAELNGGGLRYDATTDTYSLNWKTDPAWAGTCRELTLSLIDGTTHSATFAFK